jgi:hypothetical protein
LVRERKNADKKDKCNVLFHNLPHGDHPEPVENQFFGIGFVSKLYRKLLNWRTPVKGTGEKRWADVKQYSSTNE